MIMIMMVIIIGTRQRFHLLWWPPTQNSNLCSHTAQHTATHCTHYTHCTNCTHCTAHCIHYTLQHTAHITHLWKLQHTALTTHKTLHIIHWKTATVHNSAAAQSILAHHKRTQRKATLHMVSIPYGTRQKMIQLVPSSAQHAVQPNTLCWNPLYASNPHSGISQVTSTSNSS